MDFGPPEKVLTQFLKSELIRVRSEMHPGTSYLFRRSKPPYEAHNMWKSVWSCITCEERRAINGDGLVCRLHVQHNGANETMITDPLDHHHIDCIPKNDGDIEAKNIQRKMNAECKRGTKRPRQAYLEASAEIAQRFGYDDDLQEEIEQSFPEHKKARRSLFRASEKGLIRVDDPRNIPQVLQCTLRGRYAGPESRFANERWLLYTAPENQPLMLIFASDLDLQNLHQSHLWIGDGTFNVAPEGFVQLYTIHAFGRFESEVVPTCSVLLVSKTIRDYQTMLEQIRDAIIQRFGNIGLVNTILVDFEYSMHQAIRHAMPFVRISGCNFHFGQALNRKKDECSLHEFAKRPVENQLEHPFRIWLGKLKSLALLPVELVPLAWDIMNQNVTLPVLPTPIDQANLQRFVQYFHGYWMLGNQMPQAVWNHWLSSFLRTTNHAEGYHNVLSNHEIVENGAVLRNFLDCLQKKHNQVQQHVRRLISGRVQPMPRDPVYARLHNDIEVKKREFFNTTQQLWNFPNFNPRLMFIHQNNAYQWLRNRIDEYLGWMRYRIGDRDVVNDRRDEIAAVNA